MTVKNRSHFKHLVAKKQYETRLLKISASQEVYWLLWLSFSICSFIFNPDGSNLPAFLLSISYSPNPGPNPPTPQRGSVKLISSHLVNKTPTVWLILPSGLPLPLFFIFMTSPPLHNDSGLLHYQTLAAGEGRDTGEVRTVGAAAPHHLFGTAGHLEGSRSAVILSSNGWMEVRGTRAQT